MGVRERTRVRRKAIPGTIKTVSKTTGAIIDTVLGSSQNLDFETCHDVTMPPPYTVDHPLTIERASCGGLSISGEGDWGINPTQYSQVFSNWNPVALNSITAVPALTAANTGYWKTKALANINPNKPAFDLPLFLFELKDFPRMLKQLGDILRDPAKAASLVNTPEYVLAFNFGWGPLLSDLDKLLKFQKAVKDRNAVLQAMERGSHFRRSLGTHTVQDVEYGFGAINYRQGVAASDCIDSNTAYGVFAAGYRILETHKVWYTANAKLDVALPDDSGDDLSGALGLGIRPDLLWNMIPWSFLIDYFSNVGDILSANGGLIPFKVTRMNLMISRRIQTTLVGPRVAPRFSFSGDGSRTRTSKSRNIYASPTPSLSWTPYLNGTQLINLASLVTAGALKGHR